MYLLGVSSSQVSRQFSKPNPPIITATTLINDSTVALSWIEGIPVPNNYPVTSVLVECDPPIKDLVIFEQSNPVIVRGTFANLTSYKFRLRAVNIHGNSDLSLSSDQVTPFGPAPIGTANNPAQSGIVLKNLGFPSGNYWIKPLNYGGAAVNCYVDNQSQGGGWVLIGKGRQSSDNSGGWFGTDSAVNENQTNSSSWNNPTVSHVSSSFVNYLMGGTSSGWSNSGKYMIINRRQDCEDNLGGVGDSFYHQITNQSVFSWVNQFGSSGPTDTQPGSASGTNIRYNGLWLSAGQYGSTATLFIDNYYGGGNDSNRLFTWHWSGHGAYHGWSSGSTEFRGFQSSNEGHALQHVHVWIK